MQTTKKFRLIIWCLIIFNILNFFFLVTSYSGEHLKEGTTFFDVAFNINIQIETRFGFTPKYLSSNSPILFLPILIINAALIIILVKSSKNYFLKLDEPYKPLMIVALIGFVLHLLYFNFSIPNQEKTYATMISKGMIGNMLFIVSYVAVVAVSVFFINNEGKDLKISKMQIVSIFIIIELIISFFFFSIVNNAKIWISGYEEYGKKDYWQYYNRLFFSPFEMTYKHNNYYNLDGKNEAYSYMWIILMLYVISFVITFIKRKWSILLNAVLPFICAILMFIGATDMFDSYLINYACIGKKTFFSCIGLSFYIIIILNLMLVAINIYKFVYYNRERFIVTNDILSNMNPYSTEDSDNKFDTENQMISEEEIIRKLVKENSDVNNK